MDLSHTLQEGMPVYPGTEPPSFTQACTLEVDGYVETRLTMLTHVGTHVDAPGHIIPGGATLDELPVAAFTGTAVVVDVTGVTGREVSVADLRGVQDRMHGADFVLLRTGWSAHWGAPAYFQGFPVLSAEAAAWLVAGGRKGVGVDAISVDVEGSSAFPVHRAILGCGAIVVENLVGLEQLPAGGFPFACFPLRVAGADGSPVRAVAWVGDGGR
jgi:kynurenine formamidase